MIEGLLSLVEKNVSLHSGKDFHFLIFQVDFYIALVTAHLRFYNDIGVQCIAYVLLLLEPSLLYG